MKPGFWLTALTLLACAESTAPGKTAAPAQAQEPGSRQAPSLPARYVALGDSFTIGTGSAPELSFPSRLAARWKHTTVRNLAVNGYRTSDVIERELPAALAEPADFATLAVGANDIVRGGEDGDVAYRSAVRTILTSLAQRVPPCRIVALPQPDWSKSPVGRSFGSEETIARKIRAFNDILREESRARGARYVDLFPLMSKQASAGMLASDGLHPSAAAYDEWADAIARALESEPLPTTCP